MSGVIFSPEGFASFCAQYAEKENQFKAMIGKAAELAEVGGDSAQHDNAAFEELRRTVPMASARLASELKNLGQWQILPFPKDEPKTVTYGRKVTFELDGNPVTFELRGYGETDLEAGKLAYLAPLAQAMIKQQAQVGDEFSTEVANRKRTFKILKIENIG